MPTSVTDLAFTVVLADIALVLVAGSLLVGLARRLGQPPVIGEITAGIALGPSVLGLLPGHLTERLFPPQARPFLSMIAQVGLALFMFLVGWEFNTRLLDRRSTAVVSVSLTNIALSFALGAALAPLIYHRHAVVAGQRVPLLTFAVFLGVAMSITAFPVLARILTDSGLSRTPVGTLVMGSAAIGDVLAWCMLAVVVSGVSAGGGATLARVVVLFAIYAVTMAVLVRPLLRWVVGRFTRDGRVSPYLIPTVAAGVFLSSYATSWIGVHLIFGAFTFGLIMPRQPEQLLRQRVHEPIEHVNRLLLPIFFIVTGLSVDVGALGGTGVLELVLLMTAACAGKLFGGAVPAKLCGMSWRDAYSVGLLMNTRGLTELVILNIGVALGVLDGRMFTIMVLVALVTTTMTTPLLPRSLSRLSAHLLSTSPLSAPPLAAPPLSAPPLAAPVVRLPDRAGSNP